MAEAKRRIYSVSALMAYETCPRMYWHLYVRHWPPPLTPAMATGVSVHKLIADHLRQRPPGEQEPDPEVAEMLRRFQGSRFNLPPVAVEKPFRIGIGKADVRGRIDLVLPAAKGGLELVDLKSGSVRPVDELERRLQLPLYALAVGSLFDRLPQELRHTYYFLRDGAEVTFSSTAESFAGTHERVTRIVAAIESEQFEPAQECDCFACRDQARRRWRRVL